MGYCSEIPVNCQRCSHEPCNHNTANTHPCDICTCEAFEFPEGMLESDFVGGGGQSGGGGASGSW